MPLQSTTPLEPGKVYHIWTRANGQENIFREHQNYHFLLRKYRIHIAPIADTFAYCLMPNHLHFMVRIKRQQKLLKASELKQRPVTKNPKGVNSSGDFDFPAFISQQFSNLFNSYTKAYNKTYNRRGSLFSPNFKRKVVTSKKYGLNLMAYIHLNPVHHGFAEQPDEWLHSSWHAYCSDKRSRILKDETLKWAGGLTPFLRLHRDVDFGVLRDLVEE